MHDFKHWYISVTLNKHLTFWRNCFEILNNYVNLGKCEWSESAEVMKLKMWRVCDPKFGWLWPKHLNNFKIRRRLLTEWPCQSCSFNCYWQGCGDRVLPVRDCSGLRRLTSGRASAASLWITSAANRARVQPRALHLSPRHWVELTLCLDCRAKQNGVRSSYSAWGFCALLNV